MFCASQPVIHYNSERTRPSARATSTKFRAAMQPSQPMLFSSMQKSYTANNCEKTPNRSRKVKQPIHKRAPWLPDRPSEHAVPTHKRRQNAKSRMRERSTRVDLANEVKLRMCRGTTMKRTDRQPVAPPIPPLPLQPSTGVISSACPRAASARHPPPPLSRWSQLNFGDRKLAAFLYSLQNPIDRDLLLVAEVLSIERGAGRRVEPLRRETHQGSSVGARKETPTVLEPTKLASLTLHNIQPENKFRPEVLWVQPHT